MSFERIEEIVRRAVDNKSENGAAVVITREGHKVFSCAAGLADVENEKPFAADTICRAFSCTKVITSVASMLLIERGLLDTSWELRWLIPEFDGAYYVRGGDKLESPPIKIRDLLNMTSGIAYPGDGHEGSEGMSGLWGRLDESIRRGESMTTLEFAAEAGKQPLMYPAGREWMYGSSADIMGAVIEKVAGVTFGEFLRKNIFEPLEMSDTAFYVPEEKRDRLAVLYENAGDEPRKPDWVNLCIYDYDKEPAFQSGGAGIFTTAADLAKLGGVLTNGGSYKGSRIISPKAIDFMRQNGLTPEQRVTYTWDSTRGYGYGNLVRCLENRNVAGSFASVGAFGWDGWTGTYLLCDPEEKLSVTLFVQRTGAGTTQLSRDVVNAAYSLI